MPYSHMFGAQQLPEGHYLTPILREMAERGAAYGNRPFIPYAASTGLTPAQLAALTPAERRQAQATAQGEFNTRIRNIASNRIEGLSPDILASHEAIRRNIGNYEPNLARSEQYVQRAANEFPSQFQQYMNPYQQSVVDRIALEGNRNFRENVLPSLEGQFVRAGQHGSTRHQQMAERAARDMQNEVLGRQAHALATGYQQAGQLFNADQARAIEAAREMSGIGVQRQAQHLGEQAALENQGRYVQQQGQASRDLAFQEFMREQNQPMENLSGQTAVMHGFPIPMSQTYAEHRPATPQTNIPGRIGEIAGQLQGMRMMGRKRGGPVRRRR